MSLEPCPHCHRHVKITETSCPFCARSIALASTRTLPRSRLGRAALFAFVSACGDNNAPPAVIDASPPDAHVDAAIDAGPVPIYAAAPTPDRNGPKPG